ncbi:MULTISPECIES: hypothetical protein [unclassified Anaerobiospirillum]|uniref:hypothetical protein n=1 Tax=unclassified Anaerobiospirillum TaxID=2647410 RepID=UPI001FF1F3D7|nr:MULTISPECIES: hypothetical protein [unclassified Anaerobiospirillum]MCK0534689.1 hypothetical protein [Anaerobiospirillum sp. NML120511]MCK0539945.1 hypothetical protein [Anaerobiospirillum sp. NML02-A-032]
MVQMGAGYLKLQLVYGVENWWLPAAVSAAAADDACKQAVCGGAVRLVRALSSGSCFVEKMVLL